MVPMSKKMHGTVVGALCTIVLFGGGCGGHPTPSSDDNYRLSLPTPLVDVDREVPIIYDSLVPILVLDDSQYDAIVSYASRQAGRDEVPWFMLVLSNRAGDCAVASGRTAYVQFYWHGADVHSELRRGKWLALCARSGSVENLGMAYYDTAILDYAYLPSRTGPQRRAQAYSYAGCDRPFMVDGTLTHQEIVESVGLARNLMAGADSYAGLPVDVKSLHRPCLKSPLPILRILRSEEQAITIECGFVGGQVCGFGFRVKYIKTPDRWSLLEYTAWQM